MIRILVDVLLSLVLFAIGLWLIAPALVGVSMTLPERTVLAAIGVCFVGLAIQVISA